MLRDRYESDPYFWAIIEQLAIEMEPELAQRIIDKVTDIIIRLNEIYLDVAGPYIDVFEIPGDDYAGTEHLLISPKVFQRMLAPALARIVQPIKQYREDLFVAFHSDGAILIVERSDNLG